MCETKYCQKVKRHDLSLLLSTGNVISGILGLVLGSTLLERCGHVGDTPAKGHEDAEGTGVSCLWQKAKEAGIVQPGEQKAQEDLVNIYEYLKGECNGAVKAGARGITVVPVTRLGPISTNCNKACSLKTSEYSVL